VTLDTVRFAVFVSFRLEFAQFLVQGGISSVWVSPDRSLAVKKNVIAAEKAGGRVEMGGVNGAWNDGCRPFHWRSLSSLDMLMNE
jgi:hypothetical protein